MSELRPYQIKLLLLQNEYADLEAEHRELLRIAMQAVVTEFASQEPVGFNWRARSDEIAARQKAINAEIFRLEPARHLLAVLGEDFYFKYQERYPINRDTKLIQQAFPYHTMQIPKPVQLSVWNPAHIQEMPPPIASQHYTITFEEWTDGHRWYEYLAYLPETNTVYRKTKRQR